MEDIKQYESVCNVHQVIELYKLGTRIYLLEIMNNQICPWRSDSESFICEGSSSIFDTYFYRTIEIKQTKNNSNNKPKPKRPATSIPLRNGSTTAHTANINPSCHNNLNTKKQKKYIRPSSCKMQNMPVQRKVQNLSTNINTNTNTNINTNVNQQKVLSQAKSQIMYRNVASSAKSIQITIQSDPHGATANSNSGTCRNVPNNANGCKNGKALFFRYPNFSKAKIKRPNIGLARHILDYPPKQKQKQSLQQEMQLSQKLKTNQKNIYQDILLNSKLLSVMKLSKSNSAFLKNSLYEQNQKMKKIKLQNQKQHQQNNKCKCDHKHKNKYEHKRFFLNEQENKHEHKYLDKYTRQVGPHQGQNKIDQNESKSVKRQGPTEKFRNKAIKTGFVYYNQPFLQQNFMKYY